MKPEVEAFPTQWTDSLHPIEKTSDGVSFQVLIPEKMPGAGQPIGVSRQEIVVGNRVFELSYLLGARNDNKVEKGHSGDSFLAITASMYGFSFIGLEAIDFLTMHKDTAQEWQHRQHRILGREADFAGSDSAGNWLMRSEMERDPMSGFGVVLKNGFEWLESEGSLTVNNRCTRETEHVSMEKVMEAWLDSWLEVQNEVRWRVIFKYLKKSADRNSSSLETEWRKWHHHWLNGVIGMTGILIGPENKLVYGSKMSLADSMAATNVSAVRRPSDPSGEFYTGDLDPVFNDLGLPGRLGNPNVNQIIDLMALERGGLTVEEYDRKTKPNGAFMTFGPSMYRGREWGEYTKPISVMNISSSPSIHGAWAAVGSDGGVNSTRDERERVAAEVEFPTRNEILLEKGPEGVLNLIVDNEGKTGDDFLLAAVSLTQ